MFAVIAHMKHCPVKAEPYSNEESQNEEDDSNKDIVVQRDLFFVADPDLDDGEQDATTAEMSHKVNENPVSVPSPEFLLIQHKLLEFGGEEILRSLKTRAIRLPNGEKSLNMWEDYLSIYTFVKQTGMSRAEGDGLLKLLRDVGRRHECVLPIPKFFRTMEKAVDRYRKGNDTVYVSNVLVTLPKEANVDMTLEPACGVLANIMQVVSALST